MCCLSVLMDLYVSGGKVLDHHKSRNFHYWNNYADATQEYTKLLAKGNIIPSVFGVFQTADWLVNRHLVMDRLLQHYPELDNDADAIYLPAIVKISVLVNQRDKV